MKAMVYNHPLSAIKPYEEDMAFKAAYLFATMIVATGCTSGIAYFKHGYADDATLKLQLQLLETAPYPSPEWRQLVASLPGWRKELKGWSEIKHPTKAMLVARKKLLDSIKANYFILRNHMLDHFPSRAFLQLADLLTPENYGCIESHPHNPELHDDNYSSLSSIMESSTSKEQLEQGILFLLTDNFFISKAASELKVPECLEELKEGSPYLVTLLHFHDLNQYNKEELHALRQGLLPQLSPFAEAVDSWAAGFAQNEENGKAQKQRIEQVYTNAQAVGEVLNTHVLVQQMAADNREVQLVLGMLPASLVWQYFKEVNAVPDDTWTLLSKSDCGEKLCPVMALR